MDAVVGLGANLGERAQTLASAVAAIGEIAVVSAVSSLYETEPIGPAQPDFLNAAVRVTFEGTPQELLVGLLAIEQALGRERRDRFGPRTIDLDLLLAKGMEVNEPGLVVPHPRLLGRAFALAPLLDVMPGAVDPGTGVPLLEALAQLGAQGIRRVAGPDWPQRF